MLFDFPQILFWERLPDCDQFWRVSTKSWNILTIEEIWWQTRFRKLNLPAINSIYFSYPNFKILESSIDKILEMLQLTPRQLTQLKCFQFGVDFGSARVESRKHEKITLKWRYQGGMKNKARLFRKNLIQNFKNEFWRTWNFRKQFL